MMDCMCPLENSALNCAASCDRHAQCVSYVYVAHGGRCYLHNHTSPPARDRELQERQQRADNNGVIAAGSRAMHCVVDAGALASCALSSTLSNQSLVLVLVMRFETHHLRAWMHYHSHLGVRHFVIISNECDDRHHQRLVYAAASAPCNPRLTFVDSFRCASGFQTRAYAEAARALLHAGEPLDTRVAFFDVDEFLTVAWDGLGGSAVDALYRAAAVTKKPMWVLDAKPFGPSGHREAPSGFVPANFLVGNDVPNEEYGGYPKSICSLAGLRNAWLHGTTLFAKHGAVGELKGNWPHHCLDPVRQGWSVPRNFARLNHYATRHEARWRQKCNESNPTFAGLSRAKGSYCRLGIEAFFARLSNHVDLALFENLGRYQAAPAEFLDRARPPPDVSERQLRAHCEARGGLLRGAAVALCADALGTPLPAAPDGDVHCSCIKARAGDDVWQKKYNCRRSAHGDDGTYCFVRCCRPDEHDALRLRRHADRFNMTAKALRGIMWGSQLSEWVRRQNGRVNLTRLPT